MLIKVQIQCRVIGRPEEFTTIEETVEAPTEFGALHEAVSGGGFTFHARKAFDDGDWLAYQCDGDTTVRVATTEC